MCPNIYTLTFKIEFLINSGKQSKDWGRIFKNPHTIKKSSFLFALNCLHKSYFRCLCWHIGSLLSEKRVRNARVSNQTPTLYSGLARGLSGWEEHLSWKLDELSSIPGTHTKEERELTLQNCPLTSTHAVHSMQVENTHTCTHTHNYKKIRLNL